MTACRFTVSLFYFLQEAAVRPVHFTVLIYFPIKIIKYVSMGCECV